MSTHPNFDKICVAVLFLTLVLTVLFMNGERFGIEVIIDEDAENHSGSVYFTTNDLNGNWDSSSATVIALSGESARISGNGAYFYDRNLVISNAGKYVLSGHLDGGSIIVDAYRSSKVWLLLDGVEISNDSDSCFRIEQAEKVFVTLAEGSENRLTSGASWSAEALDGKRGGTIFARDDLTINGSGNLTISNGYKHGIDANDDVVLAGGSITVSAAGDAVHVKESLRIRETTLTAESEDDCLVVKNMDGYLYIESGILNLTAEDDAVHTTGKAIVAGGELDISAGDDALHSDAEIVIEGGTVLAGECYEGMEAPIIRIAGGETTIYPKDDGLNANGGTDLFGEPGFEHGGWIPEKVSETQKGQQASDSSSENKPLIAISGGSLTIVNKAARDADGVDSNGDILISGGTVRVSIVDGGTNNAFDYGSENGGVCEITGGSVIACGGSGMTEEISASSAQCSVFCLLNESVSAGTAVCLKDMEGNILTEWEVPCSFSSVVISCPEMTLGETYLLSFGENSKEITLEETAMLVGEAQRMMFGGMRWPPGFGERPKPPGEGEMSEMQPVAGEIPEMPPFAGEMTDWDNMDPPPFARNNEQSEETAENMEEMP